MNRRLPPGLIQRQYKTRAGYKATRFYCYFTCWDKKRRLFTPGFTSFKAAVAELVRLRDLNAQHYDFDRPAPPEKSFFPQADNWLTLNRNKITADKDRRSVDRLKTHFGDIPLTDFTASGMKQYRNARGRDGVSPATINRELACLRSILLLAYHDRALDKMPLIPFEAEHSERDRIASDGEYRRLLKELSRPDCGGMGKRLYHPEARAAIELCWELGFRISEVCAIRLEDLNLPEGIIDTARLRRKEGKLTRLPLSRRAWSILRDRAAGKKRGPLFTADRDAVSWSFRQACKRLEISGLQVHDLRSTFVTRKLREGYDRELIKAFTGHRTDEAFKRYARPTLDDLRKFIGG